MDKNYLDKVVDQIVRETRIDHDEEMLYTPFSYHIGFFSSFLYLSPLFPPHYFSHHCKEVYGLNEDEVKYIWKKYKEIIKDKIEGNDGVIIKHNFISESYVMDNKFLNKVAEQIISETEVSNGKVYFPFLSGGVPRKVLSPTRILSYLLYNFNYHCREVYGLNDDERLLVWDKFVNEYFYKFPYNSF